MKLNKKILSTALASTMVLGSMGTAFAAVPNQTMVFGDKAYDLQYITIDHKDEILEAFSEGGSVFQYKDNQGAWYDKDQELYDAAQLPELTYKAKNGEVTKYAAGDGDEVSQELAVTSVEALNKTTIKVTFNDGNSQEYTVAALAEGTNSRTVTYQDKEFTVEVNYNPEVAYMPTLTLDGDIVEIEASEEKEVLVTFELKDKAGNLVESTNGMVVKFNATFGNFAQERVTVENGKASVIFNPENLTEDKTSLLTAVVVETNNKDFENLKAEKELLLTPNPGNGGQTGEIGARLVKAEASQADRVVFYFDKVVDYKNYMVKDAGGNWIVNTNVVTKNVVTTDAGDSITPIGFMPVSGNDKALYAILPKSDVLTDNTVVTAEMTVQNGSVEVNGKDSFNFTDARQPEMLEVELVDLKTIKVKFSEAVSDQNGAVADNNADEKSNWKINGFKLSENNTLFGTNDGIGALSTVTVGEFNTETAADARNEVTITLGKDKNGKQLYFQAGKYSVQGSQIGDWAADSDPDNEMATQTLDFEVAEDNEPPIATVVVQTPEQYVVTFNKEIGETAAQLQNLIKMQKYDTAQAKYINDSNVGTAADEYEIVVTPVKEDDGTDSNTKFVVEVDNDWSKVYKTETTNQSYYNDQYRLFIEEGKISAIANGKTNSSIELNLGGAMLTPDTISPKVTAVEKIDTTDSSQAFAVTISEPVKLAGVAMRESTTPSESQGAEVQQPTVRFIKADNSKTVQGSIVDFTTTEGENYHTVVKATPNTDLEAGDWKIVIESLTDDIGNATETKEFNFNVEAEAQVDTDFRVLWAYADQNHESTPAYSKETGNDNDGQTDAIYVKFSQPVSQVGNAANALSTANYTLNGKTLPKEAEIVSDIKDFDDKDMYVDSITILLPDGTLSEDVEETVITVGTYIKNKAETGTLVNAGEIPLSFNTSSVNLTAVTGSTAKARLQNAINNYSYRTITIDEVVDLGSSELVVRRPVDIVMNGNVTGDIKYDTTIGGIFNLTGTGTLTGDLTVDVPNADFTMSGVTVTGVTTVKDVLSSTFESTATHNGNVVVEDNNGTSIDVSGATFNGAAKVVIDTNAEVNIDAGANTVDFGENVTGTINKEFVTDATLAGSTLTINFDNTKFPTNLEKIYVEDPDANKAQAEETVSDSVYTYTFDVANLNAGYLKVTAEDADGNKTVQEDVYLKTK